MALRNAFESVATESTSLAIEDNVSKVPSGMAVLEMLSRLVKIAESLQVVDAQQRQRVAVDTFSAAATLPTVSTVSGVTTVTTLANATAIAGMDREQYINTAKNTYANSIRTGLTFQ